MDKPNRTRRWPPALLTALALQLPAGALQAAPVQWTVASGGNDHWYEYVTNNNIFAPIGFNAARSAALASTHLGQTGYLATITSAAEQTFIQSSFPFLLGFGATGTAWLGASDAAVEGDWRWLDGPEAGQQLGYTNWALGQPVNGTGTDHYDLMALYINAVVQGAPVVYGWTSVPTNGGALGYIIEYGSAANNPDPNPVPEPGGLLMAATALGLAGLQTRRRRKP
ncbi:MAG TPA: lectin-like protein [Rubrivivax sp.]|nr:lectin-like protein [Rubrivivax sp.]